MVPERGESLGNPHQGILVCDSWGRWLEEPDADLERNSGTDEIDHSHWVRWPSWVAVHGVDIFQASRTRSAAQAGIGLVLSEIFADRVKESPELFNRMRFETSEIINSYQSGRFGTKESFKGWRNHFEISREIFDQRFRTCVQNGAPPYRTWAITTTTTSRMKRITSSRRRWGKWFPRRKSSPAGLEFPKEVIEAIEAYEKTYSIDRDHLIDEAFEAAKERMGRILGNVRAHDGRSRFIRMACWESSLVRAHSVYAEDHSTLGWENGQK
jgi:hypothetical protein